MAAEQPRLSECIGRAGLAELEAAEAAIAARRRQLEGGEENSGNKRSRTDPDAAEDIAALARVPVTMADVAGKAQVRVLLNGCFDVMHAGHYNALRQAKTMFEGLGVPVALVAGVHTSATIQKQKGPTVMTDDERVAMVKACMWVDEVAVLPDYLVPVSLLDELRCEFCAHGDDLPIRWDGTGMFHEAIRAGRFRMIKRTEGVSTTTFISRLLQATRPPAGQLSDATALQQPVQASATLLPTASRFSAFAGCGSGGMQFSAAKRVIYVDGMEIQTILAMYSHSCMVLLKIFFIACTILDHRGVRRIPCGALVILGEGQGGGRLFVGTYNVV